MCVSKRYYVKCLLPSVAIINPRFNHSRLRTSKSEMDLACMTFPSVLFKPFFTSLGKKILKRTKFRALTKNESILNYYFARVLYNTCNTKIV